MTSFPLDPAPPVYRVRLPRPPEVPAPHPFPLLATVAPIFGSLALWAIIQSPFALIFAFLGPLIAVASVGDSRISARRLRRTEATRFRGECDRTRESIAREQSRQVADLARLAPAAREILHRDAPDPEQWLRADFASPIPVRLGTGEVRSALELDGDTDPPTDGHTLTALAELRTAAATLVDGVVVVDARLGIGVCGPHAPALAVARALVVQLAAALSPVATELQGGANPAWRWTTELPHATGHPPSPPLALDGVRISDRSGRRPPCVVAVADRAADLPRDVRVVLEIDGATAAVIRHPDESRCGTLRADMVAEAEVTPWAMRQARQARDAGVMGSAPTLPDRVELASLVERGVPGRDAGVTAAPGLSAAIGMGESGALSIDLVRDGPHAVVGGTTGSGKSELLVSWVLAMAARRPPMEVSFLFVDFKGGASFDPLRQLPHCVGVITDLDDHEALRALASLRAEVRRRERMLAARGLRSVDDEPPGESLARLVLVVDEYAAMVDDHPHLAALFTDLAARGRSLGIHLILCTQRPAGTLREGLLANCGLRLSLRVNNAADSTALLGTDAAASLPVSAIGRVLVSVGGGVVTRAQVASAFPTDIVVVRDRWHDAPRPSRPWCDRLPAVITPSDAAQLELGERPGAGFAFAVADLPEHQRREFASFDPVHHGNLMVVGAGGSGKSGVLTALAEAAGTRARVVGADVAVLWDALGDVLDVSTPPDPSLRLLLLDDVDMALGRCPDEWATALLDRLGRVLREGPSRGVVCVLTTQRLAGPLHGLAALCGSSVLLRLPDRQEHLLAGGDAALWAPDALPGAGSWRGIHIQVLLTAFVVAAAGEPRALTVDLSAVGAVAVVSTRPHQLREAILRAQPTRTVIDVAGTSDTRELVVARGDTTPVLLGDPDAWSARWGALGAARGSIPVLFEGCSVAEFRSLSGIRELPPPPHGLRSMWILQPDGSVHRGRLGTSASPTDDFRSLTSASQRIS